MFSDLPLVDEAVFVGVDELEGIFQGDDMVVGGLVEVIDHCRQRRGLPGVRRPCHQDQARALGRACPSSTWGIPRESRVGISWGMIRKAAARPGVFSVGMNPESGSPFHRMGAVQLPLCLQSFDLGVGEELIDEEVGLRPPLAACVSLLPAGRGLGGWGLYRH